MTEPPVPTSAVTVPPNSLDAPSQPAALALLERTPVATILIAIIALIAAVAGAVVTITEPSQLSFAAYLDDLTKLAVGVGLLGVGRGATSAALRLRQ